MSITFERIIVVELENASRELVLENQYMSDLRKKGVFLANAFGLTHPSQPNYIAAVGGDVFGYNGDDAYWVAPYITTKDPNSQPPVTSIVDLLEAKGLTWKCYAENYQPDIDLVQPPKVFFVPPDPPYPPTGPAKNPNTDPLFARRHVPFLSFPNIVSNSARAANLVNAQSFESDLAAGKLASYVWYVPNLINNGHSVMGLNGKPENVAPGPENIANIATFLQGFLGDDPLARFPAKTLIVTTFDEAFPYTEYNIYTLLIGDELAAGTSRAEPYDHYSLLRTTEENFGLGTLGRNDAAATPYWFHARTRKSVGYAA
jgi:hypothetical protein